MGEPTRLDLAALEALGIGPATVAQRRRLDGEPAVAFLAELPALAERWQGELGLEGARAMPGGVLGVALACRRRAGAEPVVLKLSGRHASGAAAEAAALAAWRGRGACRLLLSADEGRVMLLEAVVPGTAVTPGPEDEDARRAAVLLRALHDVPPDQPGIPDAAAELDWRFERAHTQLDGPSPMSGHVAHAGLDRAHAAASELHAGRASTVLLHGDFLDKNILLGAGGAWRAIDPRPCLGDACLDAGFWALAHRPGRCVRQRCQRVAEAAGLDAGRVWAWARAFAVSEAVLATEPELARLHHAVSGAG